MDTLRRICVDFVLMCSISQEEAEAEAAPHREIRKAEAEGFVARQLAWETKRAAKTAVKKEVQEEAMLAKMRDRPEVNENSLEIAHKIGWQPDRNSFFQVTLHGHKRVESRVFVNMQRRESLRAILWLVGRLDGCCAMVG